MSCGKKHTMNLPSTKVTETLELKKPLKRLKQLTPLAGPSSRTISSQASSGRVADILTTNKPLEHVAKKPVADVKTAKSIRRDPMCSDLKEAYLALLEDCEETGAPITMEALKVHVMQAKHLFDQFKSNQPGGINHKNNKGEGASFIAKQFYWACLHNKRCSEVLKEAVVRYGEKRKVFSLDRFLTTLKNELLDDEGNYSPRVAIGQLSVANAEAAKTAPKLLYLAGAAKPPQAPKTSKETKAPKTSKKTKAPKTSKKRKAPKTSTSTKTGRRPYRRFNFTKDKRAIMKPIIEEPADETVKEDLSLSTEAVAKKMLKTVKQQSAVTKNMFELASAESLDMVVRNFLGLSFLANDGRIEISSEENVSERNENGNANGANLAVKPKKYLPKTSEGKPPSRGQTIISFNAKMLKDLMKQNAASGITGDGESNGQQS